jgi:enterobactin synthetase component D
MIVKVNHSLNLMTETLSKEYLYIEKKLFPQKIKVVLRQTVPEEDFLYPEENKLVEKAVPKRQDEFKAGRFCAKTALEFFHVPNPLILSGSNQQPLWPDGFSGSITHCDGMYGAAAAKTDEYKSLGFDIEVIQRKVSEKEIAKRVCVSEELADMESLSDKDFQIAARTIFSAKESIYKCLFPLVGKYFGFQAVRIQLNRENHSFCAFLLKTLNDDFPEGAYINGSFRLINKYVFTSAWVLN